MSSNNKKHGKKEDFCFPRKQAKMIKLGFKILLKILRVLELL